MTILISGFPGIGKTSLVNSNTKYSISDSDSSKFSRASDFPNNYIDYIQSLKEDIVLISSHRAVRSELLKRNLNFYLCYPHINLKQEYLTRYRDRGSPESFIKLLNDNWNDFIKEMDNQEGCIRIVLQEGEFLIDKLVQILK